MSDKKTRVRSKATNGFVGIMLTKDLLIKLDMRAEEMTLNRSQVIRLALLEYLKND